MSNKTKYVVLFLLILSFIVTFVIGLGIGKVTTPVPQPPPIDGPVPTLAPSNINFVPGYQYYSDGFYILAKDNPNLGLVVSVDRHQDQNTFNQSTRATYFNGVEPTRYTTSVNISDLSIHPDKYISSWTTKIDPSRVLKEKSTIALTFPGANISITTGELTNEVVARSLPGYTKLFSNGQAELKVNGVSHPAYLVYYHLNSNNASDIYFYTKPLGITTNLLVFWNQAGEAYLLDMTEVSRPVPLYSSHKIGFFIDANKTVFRTFTPTIGSDKASPPRSYFITFPQPINAKINISTNTTMSKSTSEQWYLSTVSGTITHQGVSTSGIGIMEYIHDN